MHCLFRNETAVFTTKYFISVWQLSHVVVYLILGSTMTNSTKNDRGFGVFKCPRDRFLDLQPFGPILGSSTCDRNIMDKIDFCNIGANREDYADNDDDDEK